MTRTTIVWLCVGAVSVAALISIEAGIVLAPMLAAARGETPAAGYWKALKDIEKPETQEQAAETLIAYAHTHEEVASHVAHVLAARHTHLDQADALGRSSVAQIEQASSGIDLEGAAKADPETMVDMAEYWDSLGWVKWVQGDKEAAKRYCEMAWGLGGEGLYMDHRARIAVDAGQADLARHELRVALSGAMDERERKQVITDLAQLRVDKPEAIDEPVRVALERGSTPVGKAEVWLLFVGGAQPQVKWAGGDAWLGALTQAIAAARFPAQMPDKGPEHVLRRGRVVCREDGCELVLLYAAAGNQ